MRLLEFICRSCCLDFAKNLQIGKWKYLDSTHLLYQHWILPLGFHHHPIPIVVMVWWCCERCSELPGLFGKTCSVKCFLGQCVWQHFWSVIWSCFGNFCFIGRNSPVFDSALLVIQHLWICRHVTAEFPLFFRIHVDNTRISNKSKNQKNWKSLAISCWIWNTFDIIDQLFWWFSFQWIHFCRIIPLFHCEQLHRLFAIWQNKTTKFTSFSFAKTGHRTCLQLRIFIFG